MKGEFFMSEKSKFQFLVEGERINVELSKHALERMEEREVSNYEVYSLIVKMGERILELKNGTEFAIIDKETGIGIVNTINCVGGDIFIDVVTAISNDNIWISRGIQVLNVKDLL